MLRDTLVHRSVLRHKQHASSTIHREYEYRQARGSAVHRACLEVLEDRRLLSFSPAVSYPAGADPQSVQMADFNNDGRLDLAVASTGSDTVSVRLGNSDGTFGLALTSPAADGPRSLAVGDFNRDGRLDLATLNNYLLTYDGDPNTVDEDRSNGVSVMLGNGNGMFQSPANVKLDLGAKARAVAVGDFNADGRLDLGVAADIDYAYPGDVYLDLGLASVLLGIGDASGSFQAPRTSAASIYPVSSAAAADFNGDGRPDLALGSEVYSTEFETTLEVVRVALGDGTGNLAVQEINWRIDHGPSMLARDVDGDGDADLVTANSSDISVRLGNGTGGFQSAAQTYPAGTVPVSVAVGDFNRDGRLDIAAANAGTLSMAFTVTLSSASSVDVAVHYSTSNITAIAGSDYVAGSGTLVIPAGQVSRTFSVAIIGDRLVEPTETCAVNLSSPTNVTIGDGQGVGTILDNEPRISIGNFSTREGNRGSTTFSFTVRLSAAYDQAVTVNYATANGTALSGSDFVASAGILTFAPGETVKTINITVLGDRLKETTESFFVNLFGASSYSAISDAQGIGTILDDDNRR